MKPSRGISWRRSVFLVGFLIFGLSSIIYLERFTQFHQEHSIENPKTSREPIIISQSLSELLRQHVSPFEVHEIAEVLRKENIYSVEDFKSISFGKWESLPLPPKTKIKLKSVLGAVPAEAEPPQPISEISLPTPTDALQIFRKLVEITSLGEPWIWEPTPP